MQSIWNCWKKYEQNFQFITGSIKKNGAVNTNSAIYDIKNRGKILQEINQNEPVSRGLDSQETMKK